MTDFNPQMLTLARESRGITRSELGQRIGASAGYVSKVEDGVLTPSDARLAEIAEALHYPVALFTDPKRPAGIDSPCLYHRKRKTLPIKALRLVEAKMHMTRFQVRRLLAEVEVDPPNTMHSLDPDEYGSPEKVAQALRRAWGVPRGPIRNMVELIEAAGGVVVTADFGHGKLDGLSCWEKDGPPFFYLNESKPTDILRFTLAHELGHITMHFVPTPDPEDEADRFAAEFLMPAAEIRGQLQNLQFARLGPMKTHWRVSMKNIITRAARLNAITSGRARSLYVQLSEKGYVSEEPYPLDPERPKLLGAAFQVHTQDHGYALRELSDVVRLHDDELIAKFGAEIPASGVRHLHGVG
jgi:Zn-dependent peptidase ImmA (M78 family)